MGRGRGTEEEPSLRHLGRLPGAGNSWMKAPGWIDVIQVKKGLSPAGRTDSWVLMVPALRCVI